MFHVIKTLAFLSQFTANSSSYHRNETNLSLFFLPGIHSLDIELSVAHAVNLSMVKSTQNNEDVFIECTSQSGKIDITEAIFASIAGLNYVGCGGNTVTQVGQFIREDAIFEGVEGKDRALVLNEVPVASIIRCSFLFNTNGGRLEPEIPSETAGGALSTAFSNVWIDSISFDSNRAQVGAAIVGEISYCQQSIYT